MLAAVGDLLEDIVVHHLAPLSPATDTAAVISRRRGGSAANVVAAAAAFDHRAARFIGQIGDDAAGRMLTDGLCALGAEVAVHRRGRTGTVVCLVDATGERTMLPDPGASEEFADPLPEWLDGVRWLHIPAHGVFRDAMAGAVQQLADLAAGRRIPVSVDASSSGLLLDRGVDEAVDRIRRLRPVLLLANEMEAHTIGEQRMAAVGAELVVVKRGPAPAVLTTSAGVVEIAALDLGPIGDTTGAGDAFAAGIAGGLIDRHEPQQAVRDGHRLAAAALAALAR